MSILGQVDNSPLKCSVFWTDLRMRRRQCWKRTLYYYFSKQSSTKAM